MSATAVGGGLAGGGGVMRVEVTRDEANECWNYRIFYPGGGSLRGAGYGSELWAWRAAALHLASLLGAA